MRHENHCVVLRQQSRDHLKCGRMIWAVLFGVLDGVPSGCRRLCDCLCFFSCFLFVFQAEGSTAEQQSRQKTPLASFFGPTCCLSLPSSLLSIPLLYSVNFSSLPTFPSFLSSNAAFLLDGQVHLTPLEMDAFLVKKIHPCVWGDQNSAPHTQLNFPPSQKTGATGEKCYLQTAGTSRKVASSTDIACDKIAKQ